MKWQEPPADGRRHTGGSGWNSRSARSKELDALADQLRANPGRWALVEENTWPGNAKKYQSRGLDVRLRKTGDDQRQDIYARSPE